MKNGIYRASVFFSLAIICLFQIASACAKDGDERLWLDAKINGKSVRLIFDTGSGLPILFRGTAERLGLQFTNPPPDEKVDLGRIPYGTTQPCNLTLWNVTKRATFAVIDSPSVSYTAVEGIMGWPSFNKCIVKVDALNQGFELLDQVPKKALKWMSFPLKAGFATLVMEIPNQANEKEAIAVDTGSDGGVSLSSQRWREWTAAHPNRTKTIDAYYMPGAGLVASEVTWAKEISFGQLTLTDVPVREANLAESGDGSTGYQATLGLAALKRLDFIVDGKAGIAYAETKKTKAVSYEHNRIGAVFVPSDLEHGNDLIAHVLDGSPAFEAGVRNGDVLLKIGNSDVTKWKTDPKSLYRMRSFETAAGNKVNLTLKRGEKEFQAIVVLRDLIGPNVSNHEEKLPAGLAN